ncbi:MAG: hypothetical protein U0325_06435 [Polyangiales bacterium]
MNPRSVVVCAALMIPRAVSADPPPKVCVAVVGDPDEAVRALADDVSTRVGTTEGLRGVADADSRASLRGEPAVTTNDLTVARRALRGTDADLPGLRALADQLGCGWFVELGARPAGTLVRVLDVVRGDVRSSETLTRVDGGEVVALVQRMIATPASSPTPTADGGAPPFTDAAVGDASVGDAAVGDAAVSDAAVSRAATSLTARPAERSLISRIWPWLVVGGVVLIGAAVAILVAPQPETQTRLTIVNPGAP